MEKKIRASFNDAILKEAMRRYGIREEDLRPLDGFESFLDEHSVQVAHPVPSVSGEWVEVLGDAPYADIPFG